MLTRTNHLSFTVANLDRSIDFFTNVLGLKHVDTSWRSPKFSHKVTKIKNAHLRIAYLKTSNCYLELVQYHGGEGERQINSPNNPSAAHVCFEVENFNKVLEGLKKRNIIPIGDPIVVEDGPNKGRNMCYFKDFDGNIIEIFSILKNEK